MSKSKEDMAALAEEASKARIEAAEAAALEAETACAERVKNAEAAEALAAAAEETANVRLAAAITAEADAQARIEAAENDEYKPPAKAAPADAADKFDYAANPDGKQYALVPGAMISGRLDHPFQNYVFEEGKPQRGEPSNDAWLRMQIEKGYIKLWD